MKQKLKQIYLDLSQGKLTQKEALIQIRQIKIQQQGEAVDSLFAARVWQDKTIAVSDVGEKKNYIDNYVFVCDMQNVSTSKLKKLITDSHCLQLKSKSKVISEKYCDIALDCFDKVQNILIDKPKGKVLIQVVIANSAPQVLYAGLSGLLKTANQENPNIIGQIIITESQLDVGALSKQLLQEQTQVSHSIIKYEQGARKILRWKELPNEKSGVPTNVLKEQGVYLITGGLGGLGILFAKEILKHTNSSHIIFTGRSKLTKEKSSTLEQLSSSTQRLEYRQVDLANTAQVKNLLSDVEKKYQRLSGIFHCAGMASDAFILKKTRSEFREVLAPKVVGTSNLDQASKGFDLDFFLLFSSLAASLGNVGQVDYATANGFLNQFASYRNGLVRKGKRKGRTVSINWPLWQSGGMSIDPSSVDMHRQQTGILPMQTVTGMDAFHRSLSSPYDETLIVEGNLLKMRQALIAEDRILPEATPLSRKAEQSSVTIKESISDTLVEQNLVQLADKTRAFITKEFSTLLKLATHQIDNKAPLEKYGIDSIMAMNLTNQLEKTFGSLPKTLFFEYQTIEQLCQYFVESHADKLSKQFAVKTGTTVRRVEQSKSPLPATKSKFDLTKRYHRKSASVEKNSDITSHQPIAIIGLSGRYPEATNIGQFWENLKAGKDCIKEVPKERWDWREFYSEDRTKSGHHYSKWGGFIEGVDEFDPRFFNISPREAVSIDPQERLFLQHAWMAMEDAGLTRDSLQIPREKDQSGQVGVYAGVMYGEYNLSGSLASIANRVSYVLNLHGPSMVLDTMCSSSLTAIHLACQDLKQKRTDLAIAGGVNVTIHPNKYQMLSTGQFISSTGQCQSFGEGGDGYIPGEGVGAVILKRLNEAEIEGDHIYGIIKGSALNHGGKTNGYSVPNPQSQASVISQALLESKIEANNISYIEAHGTGTKLGDPIEIAALSKAFNLGYGETNTQDLGVGFCAIGSAKSNIGHCESAAGIAGLTKVLLQMKYRQIVPSLHSSRLNPHIDFANSPFEVNQSLKTWQQPEVNGKKIPLIAGVSSFGAGGSNAHIILEEYQQPISRPVVSSQVDEIIIPLSARTIEQLQNKASDLLNFIQYENLSVDLNAMAYTLQIGREAMDERLGFLVNSVDQLVEKLQDYCRGEQGIEGVYQGQVKNNKETLNLFSTDPDLLLTVDKWISDKKQAKLLDLWVKGLTLDWHKLYLEDKPQRISLPGYPFAKQRYWSEPSSSGTKNSASTIHPLLHKNTSDLGLQCFSSYFNGDENFVTKDLTTGNKILPLVACLEMTRVALEESLPGKEQSNVLELHNTVLGEPIFVTHNKAVKIALLAKDEQLISYEIFSENTTESSETDSSETDSSETDSNEKNEIIHCQGHAVFNDYSKPTLVSLEQLKGQKALKKLKLPGAAISVYQDENELIAEIKLDTHSDIEDNLFVLHPQMMNSVLQVALGIENFEQITRPSSQPVELDFLRVLSTCKPSMVARVSYSGNHHQDQQVKLDADLMDQKGNICIQMRGLVYQTLLNNVAESRVEEAFLPTKSSMTTEILEVKKTEKLIPINSTQVKLPRLNSIPPAETNKPVGITLSSPAKLVLSEPAQVEKSKISSIVLPSFLSEVMLSSSGSAPNQLQLLDNGDGIFSIKFDDAKEIIELTTSLIEQFIAALNALQQTQAVKVVMLFGGERSFLDGNRQAYNDALEQKLFKALIAFPYPTIAVMRGDASGAGFLIGALCDFMLCSESARYQYANPQTNIFPSLAEARLFQKRLGVVQANDFLYQSKSLSGTELLHKGWSCSVLPDSQVESQAQALASSLNDKSQDSLGLLKKHLSRHLINLVEQLVPINASARVESSTKEKIVINSPVKYVQLETHLDRILVIKWVASSKQYTAKSLLGQLTKIFEQVDKTNYFKSIVLVSEHPNFLPESKSELSDKVALGFKQILLEVSIPVVAVLNANAQGVAWFVSQFCDACVYTDSGKYSTSNIFANLEIFDNPELAKQATVIFSHRLGDSLAKEVLLVQAEHTGVELHKKAGSLIVVKQKQALEKGLHIAELWLQSTLDTLVFWKKETGLFIQQKINNTSWLLEGEDHLLKLEADTDKTYPYDVSLNSKVVSATVYQDGVLVVSMEDRQAKNMFSEDFVKGMNEAFEHIELSSTYKVVVLVGYDNYFASGGTKDGLLAIQEGRAKFTDVKTYQLPMMCKLPVIAAMQGHAIGAGWSMGMFADHILFSEESHYVSPYMNYGFTPGAGSTLVLPEKMGIDLARESLLTAKEYSGSELKKRGLSFSVLSRQKVAPTAIKLAHNMAKFSRSALIALKRQLNEHLRNQLEETYKLEVKMHEKTFVGKQKTLEQIQDKFHTTEKDDQSIPAQSDTVVNVSLQTSSSESLISITANLKILLAQELHMLEDEIDESTQFVDLGLDSITGVTWVRLINHKYNLSIEATKVYSYPTLSQLSQYVKNELDKQQKSPSHLVNTENSSQEKTSTDTPEPAEAIEKNSRSNLSQITNVLKSLLANELHLSEEEIEEDTQFVDLGLDSITGVTWVRKINDEYQMSMEATKVYSYPTIAQLSLFVKKETDKNVVPVNPIIEMPKAKEYRIPKNKIIASGVNNKLKTWRNQTRSRRAGEVKTNHVSEPIAVIGMAGQFPQAKNLEEFWDNIAEGRNCISQVSQQRWDVEHYYQEGAAVIGKTNSRWMGALEEYDLFDPLFFTISPIEAESMDPQQRVFLQASWNSLENAGYNADSLSGSRCGVFVGCAVSDYNLLSREQQISAQGFTGGATSVLAARISYALNLQGPCLSIDTACSSSLVAIANACDSLNSSSCDLALAGGVYVMAGPEMHIKTSQSGMLSLDGRCYAFDKRANGFVPGEGVGVVVLKRLVDAQKDHDIVQGVIQGWGVNQDGKTNGITAPNAESQTRLQQDIYDRFDIDPEKIQLVEAHGTGTKLGDPIEVEGLKESFKKYTQNKDYCALGSVKSNIGHCLTASAVAGFIKIILALKHKQLPPTINFEQLNEHITVKNSPFYINDQLRKWKADDLEQRQAAISSFGFSGTNAHMVISEYKNPIQTKSTISQESQNSTYIVPLSAKNEQQLEQKVRDLLTFINSEEGQIADLQEITFTLQVGRQEMEERLGVLVNSLPQLVQKLGSYLSGEKGVEGLFQGQVKKNKEGMRIIGQDNEMKDMIVDKWITTGNWSKLLDLWVKGLVVDWRKLYQHKMPQRVSLPGYPFAKERYWIEPVEIVSQQIKLAQSESPNKTLHPLLHSNTSVLSEQGFIASSTENKMKLYEDSRRAVKRISLPTYPFAKERCWIENVQPVKISHTDVKTNIEIESEKSFQSIEDIINKIDDNSMETNKAVSLLKTLA